MGRTITPKTPGHPYDDGIYQADSRELAPAFDVANLPLMCGRLAPAGQTTTCLRLTRTHALHSHLADIARERARLTRMRSDWKARNLVGWIEFSERRLAFWLTTWEIPACTCGDRAFTEYTADLESTYPVCTC